MLQRILRIIFIFAFAGVGVALSLIYLPPHVLGYSLHSPVAQYTAIVVCGLIGALLGVIISPWIVEQIIKFTNWLEHRLSRMSIQEITGGVIGLICGLLIASLLGSAISWLSWLGGIIKIVVTLVLGYLGLTVGMKRKDEISGFWPRFGKEKALKSDTKQTATYKILDTSVIIDGRIADICKTGFIEGTLVIPGFVLEELRHIADSSDLLKRNRGRRGLDILNKIRKELDVPVEINETDFEEIAEVDSKLLKMAQTINGVVLTNDFNLNKVAELQGVKVLNINELANAVKPMVLPGEEMVVQIIKEGKESNQGIAYLDDGTMIVVDGGRKHININVNVIVTSVLQTAAGRMIFARMKGADKKNLDGDSIVFDEVKYSG